MPEQFITSFRCLMLHPSPLPKYRGGSPIQNQIINGEIESAVSIFLMDSGLDSGPIYCQESFSLEGELSEIFSRIVRIGIALTEKYLLKIYNLFPKIILVTHILSCGARLRIVKFLCKNLRPLLQNTYIIRFACFRIRIQMHILLQLMAVRYSLSLPR